MPLPLLIAHVHMLPRLEAAEALEAAAVAALPFMRDDDRRSQLRSWRDEAGGRLVVRPTSRREQYAAAAQLGIGVKVVRKARSEKP